MQALAGGADSSDDEDAPPGAGGSPTYVQEQAALRRGFLEVRLWSQKCSSSAGCLSEGVSHRLPEGFERACALQAIFLHDLVLIQPMTRMSQMTSLQILLSGHRA